MLPWLHLSAVHFAVALLLSGVLFDTLALFQKLERFQTVGFWNTLLGTAALVLALASGLLSESGLGPHNNLGDALLRFHKFSAVTAACCFVLMTGARIAMRGSLRPRTRTLYLALALFGAVLLASTEAIGVTLVHTYGLGITRDTAQKILVPSPDAAPRTSDKAR